MLLLLCLGGVHYSTGSSRAPMGGTGNSTNSREDVLMHHIHHHNEKKLPGYGEDCWLGINIVGIPPWDFISGIMTSLKHLGQI